MEGSFTYQAVQLMKSPEHSRSSPTKFFRCTLPLCFRASVQQVEFIVRDVEAAICIESVSRYYTNAPFHTIANDGAERYLWEGKLKELTVPQLPPVLV